MGPFIPSITLTDLDGSTEMICNGEKYYKGSDGKIFGLGSAMTSKGNKVVVFKANPDHPFDEQYFCHGHALGTYRRFGYSVGCGYDILFALEDECYEIGAGQTPFDTI
jgi:hypothetical protein